MFWALITFLGRFGRKSENVNPGLKVEEKCSEKLKVRPLVENPLCKSTVRRKGGSSARVNVPRPAKCCCGGLKQAGSRRKVKPVCENAPLAPLGEEKNRCRCCPVFCERGKSPAEPWCKPQSPQKRGKRPRNVKV